MKPPMISLEERAAARAGLLENNRVHNQKRDRIGKSWRGILNSRQVTGGSPPPVNRPRPKALVGEALAPAEIAEFLPGATKFRGHFLGVATVWVADLGSKFFGDFRVRKTLVVAQPHSQSLPGF